VRYFATASGPKVREAMDTGLLGQIVTPAAGNRLGAGRAWCADNAAFTGGYPGDDAYLAWLSERASAAADCRFAVAPDVPFDAAATLKLSGPMLPRIRALGYPAALCAQDGLEDLTVPWDDFDVLFIAGSTAWKLSKAARDITYEAKRRGKWIHMGRVNSFRRLQYAASIGCDSCDGTYLAFGPDTNLPRLTAWLTELDRQLPWAGGR
jgi:hypothetical protein